jgi:protein-disulfide isomerase
LSSGDLVRLKPPPGERDHSLGPADAPVTLVEYGDFQCPTCRRAEPNVKELLRRMGPQIRLVFRHFPQRVQHPNAEHAAEVAEAAGAQGAFWEMHDLLFERQNALEDADLLAYARELGLDVARVAAELEAGTWNPMVQEDFASGVRSGVNGTPTFYFNGVRHDWDREMPSMLRSAQRALVARRVAESG